MIKNPVLTGFHADPSLLFVDGVFYVANSTFEYFPGVKISASTDLANWETVAYPLDEKRLLHMEGNPKSAGIWAPCLTHCDGLFYLVYTDVKDWAHYPYKDTPNYITTAKNIKGPWSDPVFINCSGFDPSLFHDEDGRKYFVSMEWDYRKTDSAQFSGILLTELDPVTLLPIAKPIKIFKGSERGFVEGPHLYKKDGFYYLFCAEGGTGYDHAETVARAKTIQGPYEMHPNTHLISTKHAPHSPLQKTGHGDMAQGPDGRWWFAFLCGRPLPNTNRCPLGRETGINEIIWENDWPYLKNKTIVPDESFEGYGERRVKGKEGGSFATADALKEFQSLRSKPTYSVDPDGVLRLWGGNSPACNFSQGVLLRRQTDFAFDASTSLTLTGENFQQLAGMIYRYDEKTYYFLCVSHDEETKEGEQTINLLCSDGGKFFMPMTAPHIIPAGKVRMNLTVNGKYGRFSYETADDSEIEIPYDIDISTLSDDYATPLGFTGAFVGMCCVDMRDKTAYADFYDFIYEGRVD